jgi:hypothetical protein
MKYKRWRAKECVTNNKNCMHLCCMIPSRLFVINFLDCLRNSTTERQLKCLVDLFRHSKQSMTQALLQFLYNVGYPAWLNLSMRFVYHSVFSAWRIRGWWVFVCNQCSAESGWRGVLLEIFAVHIFCCRVFWVKEVDYVVRSVHIVVWFGICELGELNQTETEEKSSNVHVARRTLPVVVVQPCDCGGVTKVIRCVY